MTWPTEQTKQHADQGTDDPKQWRVELNAFIDRFNALRNHVTSFMQTFLSRATAADARSDLGLGTAALKNTGTSGDAVPLLDQTADFSGQFRLSGTISPAQLTADVNDYSPSGLSAATALRLSSDAERTITGLSGGAAGRLLTIVNVGSQNIVLAHQSGSSTAANRFLFASAAALTLAPEQAVTLRYDATTARWRRAQEVTTGLFTEEFVSAEQTITSGGSLSLSHGLTGKPKVIQPILVNQNFDLGYSPGDEVYLSAHPSDRNNNQGHGIVRTATTLEVRFGANPSVYSIANKSTGALSDITSADWKLVVQAWR